MVLPVWIEHTTSPLPRGCSTTELRQQNAHKEMKRRKRGGNCHTTPRGRKAMAEVGNIGWPADNMAMTQTGKESDKPRTSSRRSQRLAMELRENLRRRKAQERGRATQEGSSETAKPDLPSRNDRVP